MQTSDFVKFAFKGECFESREFAERRLKSSTSKRTKYISSRTQNLIFIFYLFLIYFLTYQNLIKIVNIKYKKKSIHY